MTPSDVTPFLQALLVVLTGLALYLCWPVFAEAFWSLFDPEADRFRDVDELVERDRSRQLREVEQWLREREKSCC